MKSPTASKKGFLNRRTDQGADAFDDADKRSIPIHF